MVLRSLAVLLFLAISGHGAQSLGQVAVNAGYTFAFGVPEGPDRQTDSTRFQSRIFLTIIGTAEGCAKVTSPNGFTANVDFPAGRQREIEIPLDYMQKWDLGLNAKGFIVESTQPIHLELHVVFPGASESTQIFPVSMLDGDYVLSGWSIWNDTLYNEDNRAQFLITAAEDDTEVIITAPNGLLPDIVAGSSFSVTLDAGECYMGKMDTTMSVEHSTSQVIVKASKPVNILQANTCGYVPYAVQACNMLLDNVLPKKYFDTIFVVQPISRFAGSDHILLTAEVDNFGAITSDGTYYQTNSGRLDIIIDTPTVIQTTVPVMCQLLTPGASHGEDNKSDPSWVTIPPMKLWDDTLVWFAQPAVGGLAQSFQHFVAVIGPQSVFDEIMLDDRQINSLATLEPIPGTEYFAMQVTVPTGAHKLSSPVPIAAIANGAAPNDVYSLLPGGTLPPRFHPAPNADLKLTSSAAHYCGEALATLANSLTLTTKEQITDLAAVVRYDASVLRLVVATPGNFFAARPGVAIDVSVSGEIRVTYEASSYITGVGELINASFAVDGDVVTTSLGGSITLTTDEVCDNTREFTTDLPIPITKVHEQSTASITLSDFSGQQGGSAITELNVSGLQADASVREFDVTLVWDRDFLEFQGHDASGMIADGWSIGRFDESPTRMRLRFTAPPGAYLTNGAIARLNFKPFLSDAATTEIIAIADLNSERKCPLELSIPQTKATFDYELLCGEDMVIEAMAGRLGKSVISPNPASRFIQLDLSSPMTGEVSLLDAVGRTLRTWQISGVNSARLDLPVGIASGIYTMALRTSAGTRKLPLIIQK